MALRTMEVGRVAMKVAEALGLAHFITANLFIALGESTGAFSFLSANHAGVEFVMKYMDAPIYALLEGRFDPARNAVVYFMWTEFVVIISSALYGLLCWFVARVLLGAFRL